MSEESGDGAPPGAYVSLPILLRQLSRERIPTWSSSAPGAETKTAQVALRARAEKQGHFHLRFHPEVQHIKSHSHVVKGGEALNPVV